MSPTKIEWTDETWSPVTGCTPTSAGCDNCYARRMAKRIAGRFGYPKRDPFKVTVHQDKLWAPLKWRKPRSVFVCAMGDLFHPHVPWDAIAEIWGVMAVAGSAGMFEGTKKGQAFGPHTFQVLTKRPGRMMDILRQMSFRARVAGVTERLNRVAGDWLAKQLWPVPRLWPLPNVWVGTSLENEGHQDRLDALRSTPAAVRFLSCEPLLSYPFEPEEDLRGIDWVIAGAETGLGKRPMDYGAAMAIMALCHEHGVPFFFKKNSEGTSLLGGLEYREMPTLK